jgi:hypothetical protein
MSCRHDSIPVDFGMTAGTGVDVWQTAGDIGDALFENYSPLWAE